MNYKHDFTKAMSKKTIDKWNSKAKCLNATGLNKFADKFVKGTFSELSSNWPDVGFCTAIPTSRIFPYTWGEVAEFQEINQNIPDNYNGKIYGYDNKYNNEYFAMPVFKLDPKTYNDNAKTRLCEKYPTRYDKVYHQNPKPNPNATKCNLNDMSPYYSYLMPTDVSTRFTKYFDQSRWQVWIFIFNEEYPGAIGYNLGAGLHGRHTWSAVYARDQLTGQQVVNICDSNSVHTSNYNALTNLQYVLINTIEDVVKQNFRAAINIQMNISTDFNETQFYEISTQLQNNEAWGLCQTFGYTFYYIYMTYPVLAFYDVDNVIQIPEIKNVLFYLEGLIDFSDNSIRNVLGIEDVSFEYIVDIMNNYGVGTVNDFYKHRKQRKMEVDNKRSVIKTGKMVLKSRSPRKRRKTKS